MTLTLDPPRRLHPRQTPESYATVIRKMEEDTKRKRYGHCDFGVTESSLDGGLVRLLRRSLLGGGFLFRGRRSRRRTTYRLTSDDTARRGESKAYKVSDNS
jgi:hypothetical protein